MPSYFHKKEECKLLRRLKILNFRITPVKERDTQWESENDSGKYLNKITVNLVYLWQREVLQALSGNREEVAFSHRWALSQSFQSAAGHRAEQDEDPARDRMHVSTQNLYVDS